MSCIQFSKWSTKAGLFSSRRCKGQTRVYKIALLDQDGAHRLQLHVFGQVQRRFLMHVFGQVNDLMRCIDVMVMTLMLDGSRTPGSGHVCREFRFRCLDEWMLLAHGDPSLLSW